MHCLLLSTPLLTQHAYWNMNRHGKAPSPQCTALSFPRHSSLGSLTETWTDTVKHQPHNAPPAPPSTTHLACSLESTENWRNFHASLWFVHPSPKLKYADDNITHSNRAFVFINLTKALTRAEFDSGLYLKKGFNIYSEGFNLDWLLEQGYKHTQGSNWGNSVWWLTVIYRFTMLRYWCSCIFACYMFYP